MLRLPEVKSEAIEIPVQPHRVFAVPSVSTLPEGHRNSRPTRPRIPYTLYR